MPRERCPVTGDYCQHRVPPQSCRHFIELHEVAIGSHDEQLLDALMAARGQPDVLRLLHQQYIEVKS